METMTNKQHEINITKKQTNEHIKIELNKNTH